MVCNEVLFSDHAITQMFKRNISVNNIKFVIVAGEVIAEYSNDKPHPSYLILGYVDGRPIHIVLAKDNSDKCIIVTAYEPDITIWQIGFKLKKG